MYTLIDYVKYYKDTPLEKVSWNQMDTLLCSVLVYLPVDTYTKTKTLKEFSSYSKDFSYRTDENSMAIETFEYLDLIKDSKRYKDLKISNFTRIRNEETQFGAAHFKAGKVNLIVFKGTDNSLIGWVENFRIACDYPTYTHQLAIEYLKVNGIIEKGETLYVAGHSKGGNLAMVSALEAPYRIFKTIEKVYNFDGPGFRKEEFSSEKYTRLKEKLVNILPPSSIVGTLLYNENYTIVESNRFSYYTHFPTSWCIFGEHFIEDKQTILAQQLHSSTTKAIEDMDYKEVSKAMELIFQCFDQNLDDNFELSLRNLKASAENLKDLDPKLVGPIFDIVSSMIKANYHDGTEKVKNITNNFFRRGIDRLKSVDTNKNKE